MSLDEGAFFFFIVYAVC